MAKKIVDITEKLSFDENPCIIVKGMQIEVNADAETSLKVMGALSTKGETQGTLEAYSLLIGEKDRTKLAKLKLPMKDLLVLIEIAMNLVMGEDDAGEDLTHTMT